MCRYLCRSQSLQTVYTWRLTSGGFLPWSKVTDLYSETASSSAGPSAARSSQQCIDSTFNEPGGCNKGETKQGLIKGTLHEFPKNLKDKFWKLAGGPEEAWGQWGWLGCVSRSTLSSWLATFTRPSQKMMSLPASPFPTVSAIQLYKITLTLS